MTIHERDTAIQNSNHSYVVFILQDQRYALRLTAVERVVQAVELTPLPKAPEIVLGVFNLEGRVIPVLEIRRRFRMPNREVRLSDHLLVARTPGMSVALLVDRVEGVIEREEREITPAETVLPQLEYLAGITKLADGLILIHDLATFLSLDEEQSLRKTLGGNGH